MTITAHNPENAPAPLALLIGSLPPRRLLDFVKGETALCRVVLQGFTPRTASLARPIVQQRLLHELERQPKLAVRLLDAWKETFTELLHVVNAADFTPSATALRPLLERYGTEALRYGLLHTEREGVRAWADRLAEIDRAEAPPAANRPGHAAATSAVIADVQSEMTELRRRMQAVSTEHDALRREVAGLRGAVTQAQAREADLTKQLAAAEARVEREQRRARKAEDEVEELRKQLRLAEHPAPTAPVAAPTPTAASIAEAILLVQRGLAVLQATAGEDDETPPLPPIPPSRPVRARADDPTIAVPSGHGKQSFRISRIRAAFADNDVALVDRIRDGLARLANQPAKEQALLAQLETAGIPRAVLTGPLRPAIVDGSNVANMSPHSRGRLAFLPQIRRAAWEEGYFPVFIIVDASLRHRIDQPDLLMDMVERGEITMAQSGTSADELLIEEAARRGAVIITNDRLADWPAAKSLEKRHIAIDRAGVRLGNFHNSARLF